VHGTREAFADIAYIRRLSNGVMPLGVDTAEAGSMDALYDRAGQVIGWTDESGRIMTLQGTDWFWRDNEGNVYDYRGRHYGWWKNGHWRGADGGVLAWQPGATSLGVIPPIPAVPPIPPIPSIEQIRPIPSIPPIPPIDRMGWSNVNPHGITEKGSKIYDVRYRSDFERRHFGKFAAIDIETETAYVGDFPETALKQAKSANPRGVFYLVRVGSRGAFKVSRLSHAHPRII
jgi:hypothetical protein